MRVLAIAAWPTLLLLVFLGFVLSATEGHAAETCVTPPQPGFRIETYKMEAGKMVDCTYARLPGQAGSPLAATPTAPSLQQARDAYCAAYPLAPTCQPPVYAGQVYIVRPWPAYRSYAWHPVWAGGGFHHWGHRHW